MINRLYSSKTYKIIKKLLRFYLVWGIAFLWNALLVYVLLDVLHLPYYIAILAMIAYAIPIYYLQKYITFKYHKSGDRKRIIYFIWIVFLYQIFTYFANAALYSIVHSHAIVLVISTILFTILSYLAQNILIFKDNNA